MELSWPHVLAAQEQHESLNYMHQLRTKLDILQFERIPSGNTAAGYKLVRFDVQACSLYTTVLVMALLCHLSCIWLPLLCFFGILPFLYLIAW
jgi:hypothetical protein